VGEDLPRSRRARLEVRARDRNKPVQIDRRETIGHDGLDEMAGSLS
jgi:hypothetical protein